jgi:two-component system sensor histidine kinase BarA
MKHKSIKADVWRLILIPALSISLLLAGTLTYLYIKQLNKFVSHRGGVLTQKMAHLSHYALRSGDDNMIHSILEASLEEPFIRAIHLYHHDTNRHFHAGPQFMELIHGNEPDMEQPSKRFTVKSILFAHPVVDNKGQQPIGWVEMELLTSPFLVLRYETLLIAVIITVLCLILAAWLAIRLHQNITIPLSHLRSVIRKLASGKLQSRVEPQQGQEFFELAESVNAMALSMEKAQQDMQAYIDQSTEDLRETLETIEIQNIDLDIARKEALEASRIKSEFLANTSHEIRTPLNGILGFTNLALKTDLDEQQREYLNTIRDSSQHLLTVINSILDFSKIEAGKLTLDYVPLSLRRSIDEAAHILAPDAHEKNLQIITYIDPEIPTNLLGDPLRFKQIITNLVSNAIKFSNKGNVIVDVVLLTRQEAQATIKVTVSDEGIGLARKQKDNLFNAFAQADTSSAREHGGTGLGLAISKGLVERMGGEIGVESEPERGSSFWFTARLGIDKKQP